MGGSSTKKTHQTQTSLLPENQQGNVDLMMSEAAKLYGTGGPGVYQGPTVAGPTSQELQARQMATGYGTGAGQGFANQLLQGEQFWLNPQNVFNPQNIPGFQAATQGVTQDVTRNLTENILPGIRGTSIGGGTLGSSRQGISEGLAVGRTNDALAHTLGDMNMTAYGQGLGMYSSAAARAPQSYGVGLMPSETLNTVGAAFRGDQQQQMDANKNKFDMEQLRPFLNLQFLKDITGSSGEYGGSVESDTTQKQSGGGLGGIGKALGVGLSLLSIMYPGLAPVAAAAGGSSILGKK